MLEKNNVCPDPRRPRRRVGNRRFAGRRTCQPRQLGGARQKGAPKLLHECTYPLTAANKVSMVVTELAVFEFIDQQRVLREISPDITLDELRQKTEANFIGSDDLQPLKIH